MQSYKGLGSKPNMAGRFFSEQVIRITWSFFLIVLVSRLAISMEKKIFLLAINGNCAAQVTPKQNIVKCFRHIVSRGFSLLILLRRSAPFCDDPCELCDTLSKFYPVEYQLATPISADKSEPN